MRSPQFGELVVTKDTNFALVLAWNQAGDRLLVARDDGLKEELAAVEVTRLNLPQSEARPCFHEWVRPLVKLPAGFVTYPT